METSSSKSLRPLFWMVGISVILFCTVGIAAVMGWIPTPFGSPDDRPVASAPPGVRVSPAQKPAAFAAAKRSTAARCADCGVIESVRVVDIPGDTSALGVVGGALVGGVLGHQVGAGRGKDLATVAGAVGGAMAGNEIEKQARSSKHDEVTVRFADGTTTVFTEVSPSQWRPGERVRVINGVVRPQD